MPPLRIALCDDEPLALDRLRLLLADCADVEIVGSHPSGRDLLASVGADRPEVILLDIEMPQVDGFDVVEGLSRMAWQSTVPPLIVFVTAHPRFAVDAFESGAVDFISKPVRLHRLERALGRARQLNAQARALNRLDELAGQLDELKRRHEETEGRPHLWIRKGAERSRIDLGKVEWVAAEGEYVRFHVGAESYLERGSLSDAARLMEPAGFARIHRSAIVNVANVAAVENGRWGALTLRLESGRKLPVGKKYRPVVRALVQEGLARPGPR
jgi:DNA-binding LytR/AlgR family response regulator